MTNAKKQSMQAKAASATLAHASTEQKNNVLKQMAQLLLDDAPKLIEANKKDISKAQANGQSDHIVDRLLLTEDRIQMMANSILTLVELPDPIGATIQTITRPNGLKIEQISTPFGVVGMIYEARPNVTVDACTLTIKTGNAVVLRGSASAIESNKAIVHTLKKAFAHSQINPDVIQLLEDSSHEEAARFMKLKSTIDVLIPRGGASLINKVIEEATIPVIETGVGNCHVYLAESANPILAKSIVLNAKTQRPSVCNACETLIVHENFADQHLHDLAEELLHSGVSLVGDSYAVKAHKEINHATEDDWSKEYLDLILAIRCVKSTEEALAHITQYGTKHSEAIVTEDINERDAFFKGIDAACIYHNASTRFTDGIEFGFGAEIGISTQKLHARGPMGLEALTTSKYCIYGNGQIK
ncbi:glutamate-5-semialdehyde dehydrogenase [Shouchella patagoniensis]|uniref:glutamate-5-semialdehyde dehydrogenase n=1 Tax=Shouchella patagoniensis TaxID=228576 RepID=UPI000995B760|nr:glutamate-5-semialdehyde dehydrogenase [Shouchella patagoniensis]